MWSPPKKLREVQESWWDQLLDGTLWVLALSSIPFPVSDHTNFRAAVYRQATKRMVNVSIRTDGLGRELFIQGYPKGTSGYDVRRPLSDAQAAPPMPLILRTPAHQFFVPPPADHTRLMEEMLKDHGARGWRDYPPAALRTNPHIGWIVQECNCDTINYRLHSKDCGAYCRMPELHGALKNFVHQSQPPEEWIIDQERFRGAEYWVSSSGPSTGRVAPTPSSSL